MCCEWILVGSYCRSAVIASEEGNTEKDPIGNGAAAEGRGRMLRWGLLLVLCLNPAFGTLAQCQDPPAETLVTVNGTPITRQTAELAALVQGATTASDAVPRVLLEQLIDQTLIAGFLEDKSVELPQEQIERAVERLRKAFEQRGRALAPELERLSLSDSALRQQLTVPLTWQAWMRQTVTADDLQEYFAEHRSELDGTRVRASQILIRASDAAQRQAALRQLQQIRDEIAAGALDFPTAVARYSQAPSRRDAGDVGFFPYQGKMPVEFTQHVFALQPGALSQPFATRFGVHLCQVTDRIPGSLTLEDVRAAAFSRLSRTRWESLVQRLRRDADITWHVDRTTLR